MLVFDKVNLGHEVVAIHQRQRGVGEAEVDLVGRNREVELRVFHAQLRGARLQGRSVEGLCRGLTIGNLQLRVFLTEVGGREGGYHSALLVAVDFLHGEVAHQSGIAVVHALVHTLADEGSVEGSAPDTNFVDIAREAVDLRIAIIGTANCQVV